jgi:hypothetical protein
MTRPFVLAAALTTLAIGSGTTIVRAQDIVEIRMRGRFYSEPATIRLTVAVEPDERNRTLVVQADGERLFRSSQVALDGDKGQRIHTVEFKNLPAGYYVLRAEVLSSAEVRGAAEQTLVVGEPGAER